MAEDKPRDDKAKSKSRSGSGNAKDPVGGVPDTKPTPKVRFFSNDVKVKLILSFSEFERQTCPFWSQPGSTSCCGGHKWR